MGCDLSIVVPCYNEAANVEELCSRLAEQLPAVVPSWEVVLVNDGSKDDTAQLALSVARRDPRFTLLSFSRNFGKEAAMLAGLERASGDAIIIMDGDLQHPIEMIPSMHAKFREGFDQVIARRDRKDDPALRTFLSRTFYRVVNSMVEVRLADGAGDFRLLSRRAKDSLIRLQETNRFSKGLFNWIGYPTAVIDYTNVQRAEGTSSWTLRKLFDYALDGILSFNPKPLRAAIWLGLTMSGLMMLYVVFIIVAALIFGVETPGYVTTITSVVLLGGVQLAVVGILGEYIGRIYMEVKRRPHYLIAIDSADPATNLPQPADSSELPSTDVG